MEQREDYISRMFYIYVWVCCQGVHKLLVKQCLHVRSGLIGEQNSFCSAHLKWFMKLFPGDYLT